MEKQIGLSTAEVDNLRRFFRLVLEDYIGNLSELMEMSDVDQRLLDRFLYGK